MHKLVYPFMKQILFEHILSLNVYCVLVAVPFTVLDHGDVGKKGTRCLALWNSPTQDEMGFFL